MPVQKVHDFVEYFHARDVHGEQKAVARTVHEPAVQVLLRRESDGVQREVEPSPAPLDLIENSLHLTIDLRVERHENAGCEHEGVEPSENGGKRHSRNQRSNLDFAHRCRLWAIAMTRYRLHTMRLCQCAGVNHNTHIAEGPGCRCNNS